MMYKLKKQLPNIITLSRIISLVVGFILFMKGNTILSLIFYIYGAISDSIDGYFARKLNAYTKFGQYLDAISDKLYFLSLIIILLVNKKYLIIYILITLGVLIGFSCSNYLFGSNTDWLNQHTAFPEYFRKSFYTTHNFFLNFIFFSFSPISFI